MSSICVESLMEIGGRMATGWDDKSSAGDDIPERDMTYIVLHDHLFTIITNNTWTTV